ncbi:MAG: response regulator with CheY-like receiver domain and winged-helix DNA-binding domain [Verrucomicrobiales bacterium]|nr:response regulator with CheY-like receiver domain and winged-helix DNA-binding domain [Verrucomicrobiales bacterium]
MNTMSTKGIAASRPRAKIVLIAEDDPNDVTLFERAGKTLGCQLDMRVVNDGEEVIAWLAGRNPYNNRDMFPLPDLVVTDLKMPKVGGIEVLAWMRGQRKFRKFPVVVFTSSD